MAVMAFDLANAVLIMEKRLHVAIPRPENETLDLENESLGRERDPSRKTEVTVSQ
jgi:hypothetical protein